MKIQITSDLHTEFWRGRVDILERVAKTDADVLVLAGDIGSMNGGMPTWIPHVNQLLHDRRVPIVKISGNHEYYSGIIEDVDDAHSAISRNSDGMFISANPGVVEIQGVTFILATLWAAGWDSPEDRAYCAMAMNDYNYISTRAPEPGVDNETELFVRRFKMEDNERINRLHTDFIFNHLSGMTSRERKGVVVVTHHTPSKRSIMPEWRNHRANGAYQNNFDALIEEMGPALWIHGHTHGSADYKIGATRVVANPLGYRGASLGSSRPFENPDYKTGLVVEV
jgi:Icc-related predicted phosphoesterase